MYRQSSNYGKIVREQSMRDIHPDDMDLSCSAGIDTVDGNIPTPTTTVLGVNPIAHAESSETRTCSLVEENLFQPQSLPKETSRLSSAIIVKKGDNFCTLVSRALTGDITLAISIIPNNITADLKEIWKYASFRGKLQIPQDNPIMATLDHLKMEIINLLQNQNDTIRKNFCSRLDNM